MAEYQFGEGFQRKLLSLFVREPMSTFGIIEPSFFTNPIHVDISRLAQQAYAQHNKNEVRISRSTMMAIVKGYLGRNRAEVWPGYRKVIQEVYEDKFQDRVIVLQQAGEFAREQKFREALVSAEKDVNGRKFDRAIKRFVDLRGFGAGQDLGLEYWDGKTDSMRWHDERRGVVPTFYLPTLDRLMGGGLGAGELAIILAGGKVGKSTMLSRIGAGALWSGKNVAIATGELSALKYRKRIDSMVTMTPSWKLSELVDTDSEELRKRLKRVQRRLQMAHGPMKGELWIQQYPTGRGKIGDIEAWLERLKQNGIDIDVLIVDYIRVFKPNERFDDQRLSIGQVCMDLRGLATERKIPVWTASQTNRAALTKERIGPEDMAEDISQFWTLDFLVALCQTKAEEEAKPNQKARLFLTAARDVGRGGMVDVFLDRNTFRVWEKRAAVEQKFKKTKM